jgi:deoxyribodipyrimidine photo-lyase
MFETKLVDIEKKIKAIDPIAYGKTRNFEKGAVTKLSPYISRGVLSTKQVMQHIQSLDIPAYKTEKLLQELAWRDYWQQVWIAKEDAIFSDLKKPQSEVESHEIPTAIVAAKTGIEAVDKAIRELYDTGYMHNHMRMYVAAICCNIAKCHWSTPAKWLYSHLLDGDLASNHLSWQWVAGSNANKKYVANQDNINKYFNSKQKETFLDVEYSAFDTLEIPEVLESTERFSMTSELPVLERPVLDATQKTLIYNYYNLDPYWYKDATIQRVLLLEPSFFEKYPVSQQAVDFVFALSKNIKNIQIFVGEFDVLNALIPSENIIYKEHPTNKHYIGNEESRTWMFAVKGYYPSFFGFWKKCKKELEYGA